MLKPVQLRKDGLEGEPYGLMCLILPPELIIQFGNQKTRALHNIELIKINGLKMHYRGSPVFPPCMK